MKQKIEIPKGLRKVICVIGEHEEFEHRTGRELSDYRKEQWKERFTVGKIYPCRREKTGRVLIITDDFGITQRASYRYFKPAEIIKRKPKPLKKRIVSKLIKFLKRFKICIGVRSAIPAYGLFITICIFTFYKKK